MIRGVTVMISMFIIALFIWLLNLVMVDSFLHGLTQQVYLDPGSSFYSGAYLSRLAQLLTFMPILCVILGIGYYLFDRVFLRESEDRFT